MKREAYPTMITPYTAQGEVDYEAVKKIALWYKDAGCDGIFASCQSSEIFFLTEDERVTIAKTVKQTVGDSMTVVASGHVSDSFEDQVRELNRICETGVDGLILITNRMDIANTSDEKWIEDLSRLIERLPADMPLGLYECPYPYKRLLTEKMIDFCLSTGRFRFIKDTCCDEKEIERRLKQTEGTEFYLYNANAQTLYESLKAGAKGYCGVMANFHPELYVKLMKLFEAGDEEAQKIADFLSIAAFTEGLAYPVTAKYHIAHNAGIPITTVTRCRKESELTDYHKMCVDQMARLAKNF